MASAIACCACHKRRDGDRPENVQLKPNLPARNDNDGIPDRICLRCGETET
jgi:hypothetical protein